MVEVGLDKALGEEQSLVFFIDGSV